MATKHKGRFNTIVKELIIGFGFLNGLWLAVGMSPETEILGFINKYTNLMPAVLQKIVFAIPIILIALTIFTIITIYRKGGVLGSLAVFMAFIAGAVVLKNWQAAAALLLISIITGLITFKNK